MKDSLFVFQNGAVDSSSVTEDSSGTNLDFFAVPVSKLTSISALEGKIVLYFHTSNTFENSKANQASVTLTVTVGTESAAAISIWTLVLDDGKVHIFDDVRSNYASSLISGIDSIIRPTTERFTSGGGSGTETFNLSIPGHAVGISSTVQYYFRESTTILSWSNTDNNLVDLTAADSVTAFLVAKGAGKITDVNIQGVSSNTDPFRFYFYKASQSSDEATIALTALFDTGAITPPTANETWNYNGSFAASNTFSENDLLFVFYKKDSNSGSSNNYWQISVRGEYT